MEPASEETVLGLDNVRLDLPIAGVATRVLAGFLDYIVVWLLMIAWFVAAIAATTALKLDFWWVVGLVVVGIFVVEYGYFAGLELLLRGQTLGKRVVGLRVVTRHGGRAGASAVLIRNAVRLVDFFFGVPLMAFDGLARRLGDRLAGTLVVHELGRVREVVIHRVPQGWTGQEVAVLESFFRRYRDLEPARAERLGLKLLAAVERDDPKLLADVPAGQLVERLRLAVDAREV
jgi:uncharacterized RDD family membrane protein YckC